MRSDSPISSVETELTMVNRRANGDCFLADVLGIDMIRLEVGDGSTKGIFNIHRKVLCNKISFFDKMFSGKFQEAATQIASFPEDDVEAFNFMLGWVYTGAIQSELGLLFSSQSHSCGAFIELVILAEKYDITQLVDNAMDYLVKYLRESKLVLGIPVWTYIYEHTRPTLKLRLFFSRLAVYTMAFDDGEFVPDPSFWTLAQIHNVLSKNSEMLMDTLTLMKRVSQQPNDPVETPICNYHRHGSEETCPYGAERMAAVSNVNWKRRRKQQN